ncbi:MAG: Hint domain-containing protein [Polyangiaceae bacterium]
MRGSKTALAFIVAALGAAACSGPTAAPSTSRAPEPDSTQGAATPLVADEVAADSSSLSTSAKGIDNSKVAPAATWDLPPMQFNSARAGGIEVRMAMAPLAPAARSVVFVVSDGESGMGGLVERTCDVGRAVVELDRGLFESAGSPYAGIRFEIAGETLAPGATYAVLACVRDATGALSVDGEGYATLVDTTPALDDGLVATPSGPVSSSVVRRGFRVVGWDLERGTKVAAAVRSARDVTGEHSVTLVLAGGRRVSAPAERAFFVVAAKEFRSSKQIEPGDELLGVDGLPIKVESVSRDEEGTWGALLTVTGADGYFVDGLLAFDRPAKRAGEKGKRMGSSEIEPLPAEVEEPLWVEAAPQSYDCGLDLFIHGLTLPEGAKSVVIVSADHEGPSGLRAPLRCEDAKVVAEVDRALFDGLGGPSLQKSVENPEVYVGLNESVEDFPTCDGEYDVRLCVRDQEGKVTAVAPAALARFALAGSSCFAPGTPVRTPFGDVPIESLKPGDPVVAYDTVSGEMVVTRVVRVKERTDMPVATLSLSDGTELRATAAHPFWVADAGFVRAEELSVGDGLFGLVSGGAAAHELRIEAKSEFDERTTVYDLSVAGPHDYFAGGVLVHNY